jgi:hypothetical protein
LGVMYTVLFSWYNRACIDQHDQDFGQGPLKLSTSTVKPYRLKRRIASS